MNGAKKTRHTSRHSSAAILLAVLLAGQMCLHAAATGTATGDRSAGSSARKELGKKAMPATDPACKPVFEASDKLLTTENHMYMSKTSGGKTATSESINAGGARYVMVGGKWTRSRVSAQGMKEQEEENKKNAKNNSCQRVGEETVNGEAATVYIEHSETDFSKIDAKVWISKSKGLIVKEELDLDTGDAGGKDRMAIRYEYSNVHAPAI